MKIDRRTFAFGAATATISAPSVLRSQALQPVRLMVVRQTAIIPSNNCRAPCIRGHIYDATGHEDLSQLSLATVSALPIICDTIERPWKNNAANVSAIPVGVYEAFIRQNVGMRPDGTEKEWMKQSLNHRWRIQLKGVQHRSAIQLHYGGDVSWSEGCLIVGTHRADGFPTGFTDTYCKLSEPEKAVEALRAVVTGPGMNPDDIKVGVTDSSGLFPELSNTSC